MGIIISSFPGCGKSYLINTYANKAKMLDMSEPDGVDGEPFDYDGFVDEVMDVINDYDIIFIPVGGTFINKFIERNIDFDLFYPSKERRGEFIENSVRKRRPSTQIMMMDRNFTKMVEMIDEIESDNCYKHKLINQGQFIGNDPAVMQYVNNISNRIKEIKNEKPEETVEEPSRGKDNDEGDTTGNEGA